MYFWNIQALKQQLIKTGLSEKNSFYYILIYLIMGTINIDIIFPTTVLNQWDYLTAASDMFITMIGIITAFRVNGGNKGEKFAERFFSISFVICIRFFVLFLSPLIVYLIFLGEFNFDPVETTVVSFITNLIFLSIFYARIAKHIRDVAKATYE